MIGAALEFSSNTSLILLHTGKERRLIYMAKIELQQRLKSITVTAALVFCWALFASYMSSAERLLPKTQPAAAGAQIIEKETNEGFSAKLLHFFWQSGKSSYEHVWPVSNKLIKDLQCVCLYLNYYFCLSRRWSFIGNWWWDRL